MSPGSATLVIRFSSLGDVLLAAHVPSFLREADPDRRVLFATKERFASILRGHPHVDRFFSLEDRSSDPAAPAPFGVRGSLGDLTAALKREGVTEVIDLHRNLRSARITRALQDARIVLASKHGLKRRMMVYARWLRPTPVPPLLRSYRALAGLPANGPPAPWLRLALGSGELDRARATLNHAEREGGFVLFGVGARWETKRWPLGRFVAVGAAIRSELGLSGRFALGPDDLGLKPELTGLLGAERENEITTVDFRSLAALAAHARAIISNDSAILHLGPALGVPAIGIFGSTIPEFGFARQGPRDQAVEIELGCRPCDVHGKRRCPLGHHRCMERLEPSSVLAAVRRAIAVEPLPARQLA